MPIPPVTTPAAPAINAAHIAGSMASAYVRAYPGRKRASQAGARIDELSEDSARTERCDRKRPRRTRVLPIARRAPAILAKAGHGAPGTRVNSHRKYRWMSIEMSV